MVDKYIDNVDSEEVLKSLPRSQENGDNALDIDTSLHELDQKLADENNSQRLTLASVEARNDLNILKQSIVEKETNKKTIPNIPQGLTQSQYNELAIISGSPDALAGRIASIGRIQDLISSSNVPSWLASKANA